MKRAIAGTKGRQISMNIQKKNFKKSAKEPKSTVYNANSGTFEENNEDKTLTKYDFPHDMASNGSLTSTSALIWNP